MCHIKKEIQQVKKLNQTCSLIQNQQHQEQQHVSTKNVNGHNGMMSPIQHMEKTMEIMKHQKILELRDTIYVNFRMK